MPNNKYADGIPVVLTPEIAEMIATLADLDGRPFDVVANEVINEVLLEELPARLQRK